MPASEILLPRRRRAVPTATSLSTRRLPIVLYVAGLVLLPVLVIAGAMATGRWSTSGARLGEPVRPAAAGAASNGGSVASAPLSDPADVKGSTTVRDVVAAFAPVTAAEIFAAFGASGGADDRVQLKTLVEDGTGMDLPAFRVWLASRRAG